MLWILLARDVVSTVRCTLFVVIAFGGLMGDAAAQSSSTPPPADQSLPAGVAVDWWRSAQENIARSEYTTSHSSRDQQPSVSAHVAAAYQAPNRAQNFRTHFSAEGIRVIPRTVHNGEAPSWEWGLTLVGIGREGAMECVGSVEPCVEGNRVEYARDGFIEWYINDERGLEQGFTIDKEIDPTCEHDRALIIELAITGNLTADVANDGQSVDFLATGGARAIHFGALAAVDATGRSLAACFEAANQVLSIRVDDRDAVYPIIIDPLATTPAWTGESNQAFAEFGFSVAAAGDVNGDGFGDVIVGTRFFDNGQTDEGRAFVYHGSVAGPSLTPNWTAERNQASAEFGYSVAPAGDVNGDGFSDVIVGAHLYDNGQTDEGNASVYHGSATGLSATANWSAEGDQVDAAFGYSVATAGDVNGDGFSDIIVGAHLYDNGQIGEGRAFVYHGSATGLSAAANWSAESDQVNAFFGTSVATAGDVNGDGFSDVIVGADFYDNGQTGEGRAFIYHGSATGLSTTANWTAESDQGGAFFGTSVAPAGDVNGDGFSDVIVGAYLYTNGQTNEGRAFVYHGSAIGVSTSADWTVESNQAEARLAYSVASAGDVNGDGFSDVIVGGHQYDNGQTNEGRAFVYHGSATGLSTIANWTAESNQADSQFGFSVATAGDVNGDGLSDVIVGAWHYDNGQTDEGRAFVYQGSAAGLAGAAGWTAESDQATSSFGFSVDTAGDVNGDGFSDVIVGAYFYDNGLLNEGRAFVYHGAATGLSPSVAWTAESDQASAFFGNSVATAGDVNGDGYGDVIVGADSYDNGQTNEGRAFVYHGSATGLPATASWTAESNQANALFGTSVATAGDVNSDGFSDVVIGAYQYDNGQPDEGRAFVYHGSATGLSAAAPWTAESDQAGAWFGFSAGMAGDVNGDGYSDVIVGAPLYDNPQSNEGRAFVYHGSATGLALAAAQTAESNQTEGEFGWSVGTAGDVNGDGYSDVIVGARFYDNGQIEEGRAFVYHGSTAGVLPGAAWTAESNQAAALFGTSVATAGDVNGDGYSDVIVGASDFGNGQNLEGRAFVYHGSTTGLSLSAAWTAESDQASAFFGRSVAPAGDVNGDGYGDVIVGAYQYDNGHTDEGRAFVYYGNEGPCRSPLPRQARTDGVTPIAPLGVSDSETEFRIRAVMLTFFGRTRISMQHEVKPLGTLFDGTGLGEGSFSDTGNDGVVNFSRLVTGLTPGTPYHWRIRARYETAKVPFQRFGPWIHIPMNGWNEADLRTAGMAPPSCQADISGNDGEVNIDDLFAIIAAWGPCPAPPANCPEDIDDDGDVDIDDLFAVIAAWGLCP